ncbi:MAG: DUF393 domain-containing protein, partial [Myxococcales bacterium]|nr:DUF393 domain-containing protein [Myxococcales bacterium]
MTGPSIDLRWAGAARVGLGAALLLDLLRRAQVARTFFSNEGVLPNHVALLREHTLPTFYMSLSRPGEVAVGLALTAVVYLLFTIGFHTRVCHLLALACLVGLGLRNPLVQAPAEPLLAALLALTVTLPLGRRLSIDALRASLARRHEKSSAELADRESPAVSHRSIAVAVLVATWSLLHVLGCLDTTDASLGYLLHHDALVSGVGRALREPLSLPWVARGVRLALLALALLLLIPRARRLAALLAGLLYGGLALTTELDLFAFVRFLPFVLLLRTPGLAARWFARDSRKRTVIFDADCGICLLVSRVLVRLDPFRRLTFVGNDELERIPDAVPRDVLETSVVVIDSKGGVHTEERAVFEIGRALPFGILMLGWCGIPGLAAIGRRGYRAIAERRIAISSWLGLGACG